MALAQLLKRIERSGDWDDDTRQATSETALALDQRLQGTLPIQSVTETIRRLWANLHDSQYASSPTLNVVARELEGLIRDLTVRFEPWPGGVNRDLSELSEGQMSLLYFVLSVALFRLEHDLARSPDDREFTGFKVLEYELPALTIFALEEPENHLAPYYLPRLVNVLKDTTSSNQAMGIVTSHSASILRRVLPHQVRHLRLDYTNCATQASKIAIPDQDEDACKYIRGAVMAHPELYFARLVVLGEGDWVRLYSNSPSARNLDHLTSSSFGRPRGSGLGGEWSA